MRRNPGLVAFATLSLAAVSFVGPSSAEAEADIPEDCREAARLADCVEDRVREAEREVERLHRRVARAYRDELRRSCEQASAREGMGGDTARALCRLRGLEKRRSELEGRLEELSPAPPPAPEPPEETGSDRAPPPDEPVAGVSVTEPVTEAPPDEPDASPERSSEEPPPEPVEEPSTEPEEEASDEPAEEPSMTGGAVEESVEASRAGDRGPVRATSAPVSTADREPEIVPMESPMTLEIELPDLDALPEGYGWPTTETGVYEVDGVRLPRITVEKKERRGRVRLVVTPAIRSSSFLDRARIEVEIQGPDGGVLATVTTDWFPVGRSLPGQVEGGLVKELVFELSEEQDRALREAAGSARLRLTVEVRD